MQTYFIPWTRDYLPEDHRFFTFLKKVFRHEFRKNWFRRISTPILEKTDLLKKVYSEKFFEENILLFKHDKIIK